MIKETALHPILINLIQSSKPIYLRTNWIWSSHLLLGLPNCLVICCFKTKILYAFLIFLTCTICPAHPIFLHTTSLIYILLSSLFSTSFHVITVRCLLKFHKLQRAVLYTKSNMNMVKALTEHHAMKAYWGSGSIAPLIFYLRTRWRWVVSFTPQPLYPQGKSP
jgi:hypothetical protein